jgi:hypothetical protein
MKNDVFSRGLEKLIEGKMKRLDRIDLVLELEFRENISKLTNVEGREAFGERFW